MTNDLSLTNYFQQWIETYKKPAVSHVTYIKYQNTLQHTVTYFGNANLTKLTRLSYQRAINNFAKTHAKRTTATFHKQIRAAILDAVEEGLIDYDFTRKVIITGKEKTNQKAKFHSYIEWKSLIQYTEKNSIDSQNFIVYLSAMTGLRFAEVLGLTLEDVDVKNKIITINKSWDYKYHSGFKPTKNDSSIRRIDIDNRTIKVIKEIIRYRKLKQSNQRICIDDNGNLPVSATINRHLEKICKELGIPLISFHGLRHTHASILLYKGVNILSVSKRLGHKDITTTQSVYLHIIKEMEERETKLIMKIMTNALSE
ncbi:MAG: tyrosine-type recombinase/integrase [Vagococcus sp.]|uniref:tyrosine-type recombinase/integrase n=1 Tax=Vagococcus sp. TaxID=1933889 RepID=UPI002FC7E49D